MTRLAKRAIRLEADGTRGRRAERAWQTLVEAGNQGNMGAVAALFFSVTNRAAYPDEETAQAFFFVYTGQPDKHQALDPDGSLLAEAYAAVTEAARTELRRQLIEAGNLHAMRALTVDRTDELTGAEFDDLARGLAEHGEWARLWTLVRDAPLDSAMTAMRLFQGWRPADAELFDQLASADPRLVTKLLEDAGGIVGDAWCTELSFAPDASEIALGQKGSVSVFALPSRELVVRHTTRKEVWNLLHLGDGIIVYTEFAMNESRVVRQAPSRPREVLLDGSTPVLARTAEGFVVAVWRGQSLWFGTATGPELREVPLADLDLPGEVVGMATDPLSQRIALLLDTGAQELVLLDAGLSVIARAEADDEYDSVRLCGPDRLLTWDSQSSPAIAVRSWSVAGDTLAQTAEIVVGDIMKVTPHPGSDTVAIEPLMGDLTWHDPATLEELPAPVEFQSSRNSPPCFSPDGSHAATAFLSSMYSTPRTDGVEVWDLLRSSIASLVTLPMTDAQPADLMAVAELLQQDLPEDAAAVVRLLHLRLEDRLGAEVALGSTRIAPGGEHDIALRRVFSDPSN